MIRPILPRGFSLLELLVAMSILAILVALAVPSYGQYVVRNHRVLAKTQLTELAGRQESFFVERKTYASTLTRLGLAGDSLYLQPDGALVTAETDESLYRLSIASASGDCPASGNASRSGYTVQATPVGQQATRDLACAVLCLDSTGLRSASGAEPAGCWRQ